MLASRSLKQNILTHIVEAIRGKWWPKESCRRVRAQGSWTVGLEEVAATRPATCLSPPNHQITSRGQWTRPSRAMRSLLPTLLGLNIGLLVFLATLPVGNASPAEPTFTDCFSGNNSLKLSVQTIYAQIADNTALGHHLNLTVIGQSPQEIVGLANGSQALGTSC